MLRICVLLIFNTYVNVGGIKLGKTNEKRADKPRKKENQSVAIKYKLMIYAVGMVAIVSLLLLITIGAIIVRNHKYEKQLAIAKQYSSSGEYGMAIEQYKKALQISDKDMQGVTLQIADMYIKLESYDDAIVVLQDCYKDTKDVALQKKVTELFDSVVEKEYQKRLTLGKKYLAHEDYDRAIIEFKKANLKKPCEEEPVALLLDTYVVQEKYDEAKEFLALVKGKFEEQVVRKLSKIIRDAIQKMDYNEILEKADEYLHQGSYETACDIYKDAIYLIPTMKEAYERLVQAYISKENYEDAIQLLEQAVRVYQVEGLKELLESCEIERESKEHRHLIAKNLSKCMEEQNVKEIVSIMKSSSYKTYVKPERIIFYMSQQDKIYHSTPTKVGVQFYENGSVYYGEFKNKERDGKGIFFAVSEDTLGYYCYNGDWENDVPHGQGELHTTMVVPLQISKEECEVKVTGTYVDGFEDGAMTRTIYKKKRWIATLEYEAKMGVPLRSEEGVELITSNMEVSYVIGYFQTGGKQVPFQYHLNGEEPWGAMKYMNK